VCADADVVVVTAGARQHPGQSRRDLATTNTAMVRALVPRVLEVAPDAVLLIVSNPCDVLTQVAIDAARLPPGRVLGSGTVLDSARLRSLLASRCGVAASNVHAYVAGEHGDSAVALWSVATIGGIPVRVWLTEHQAAEPGRILSDLLDQVRDAAYRIIAGKGATSYAIGLAAAEIIRCILFDEKRILPVSSRHEGLVHGGVCLSMPAVVGRDGVEQVLDLPLSAEERAALRASARSVVENLANVA
jgi:L-lactate dehydrogenase